MNGFEAFLFFAAGTCFGLGVAALSMWLEIREHKRAYAQAMEDVG